MSVPPEFMRGCIEFYPDAAQGWQCPMCKRVYSPSTSMCTCCVPAEQILPRLAPAPKPDLALLDEG